jgi:hypothetical protein
MKKLIAIAVIFGSMNVFAGTTVCHAPIKTERNIIDLRRQNLVEVSASLNNHGCFSNLTVRVSGLMPEQVEQILFLATREDKIDGVSVPFPIILNKDKFVTVESNVIEIRNQLIVGDILFLDIPSIGMLPFAIK